MAQQKRVFYGVQQIAIRDTSMAQNSVVLELSASGVPASGVVNFWEAPRGVQSVGITTGFDLESVRQLGQLATYEQIEDIPDIEVTVSRILDGTHPLYLMASDSNFTELIGRNENYVLDMALNIYPDTQSRASGSIVSAAYPSGMRLSAGTWTFPVDGNFTEELTFVGNNKFWFAASGDCDAGSGTVTEGILPSGVYDADETANLQGTLTGTMRRQDFDLNNTLLPSLIPGVDGSNKLLGNCAECLQSLTISFDAGRDELFCLGNRDANDRFLTLPIEVTCVIEAITRRGDLVEADGSIDNLTNEPIKVVLSDSLTFDLGAKNKLTSTEVSDADTGGGEMVVTYNFTNENDLVITHSTYP